MVVVTDPTSFLSATPAGARMIAPLDQKTLEPAHTGDTFMRTPAPLARAYRLLVRANKLWRPANRG